MLINLLFSINTHSRVKCVDNCNKQKNDSKLWNYQITPDITESVVQRL